MHPTPPPPLIKGGVSADRESGGGRGGGQEGWREVEIEEGRPGEREKRRQEIWGSQRNAFGPPFVPGALDPENHSKPGTRGPDSGPLKVNLNRQGSV